MSVIYARTNIPRSKYNLKNIKRLKPKYINCPTNAMVDIKNTPITLANYKPNPNPNPPIDEDTILHVSTNKLTFVPQGETKSFNITSNAKWLII